MDRPIVDHGEFIPADKAPMPEHIHADSRQHIRVSLRQDEQQDILLACDGVTLSLYKDYCWVKTKAGVGNIKNVGLGGVGIISTCKVKLNQELYLKFDDAYYSIKVMRIQNISNKLLFIGAMWMEEDEQQRTIITNKILASGRQI
ncbi:hypothetical protein JK628_01105 [Shewanella sp. KX20019]|uniref:hypothetical protein n=1 Tax=Shewanella sp. KX20019 TaxID=2803864 RepID=UPI0019273AE6|nr:hypothetical protein [Shewanella sp. KX20019]QQX80510.1 hypothetical protein JK628_01105 [Shewanella sp. KX20019]